MKIKYKIANTIYREELLEVVEYMIVPRWLFEYDWCDMCEKELDKIEDEYVIRVKFEGDLRYATYCKQCWDKLPKEE